MSDRIEKKIEIIFDDWEFTHLIYLYGKNLDHIYRKETGVLQYVSWSDVLNDSSERKIYHSFHKWMVCHLLRMKTWSLNFAIATT